jgi:hypothetical protein
MNETWPWLALAGLGVYHGINPAMGWLFAVALGLQEGSRKAVLQALLPLALGHEASIALVVLLVDLTQLVATSELLRPVAAVSLILFGIYKLLKPRSHPRWVGFRVSRPELALWSFLMSSAHGAGLMLIPVVLGLSTSGHTHAEQSHAAPEVVLSGFPFAQDALAVAIHTLAMLVVMGAVAIVVYEKLGVGLLRRAWVNLDAFWAAAIIAGGLFTLLT